MAPKGLIDWLIFERETAHRLKEGHSNRWLAVRRANQKSRLGDTKSDLGLIYYLAFFFFSSRSPSLLSRLCSKMHCLWFFHSWCRSTKSKVINADPRRGVFPACSAVKHKNPTSSPSYQVINVHSSLLNFLGVSKATEWKLFSYVKKKEITP